MSSPSMGGCQRRLQALVCHSLRIGSEPLRGRKVGELASRGGSLLGWGWPGVPPRPPSG